MDFSRRQITPEWMDEPEVAPAALERSLTFIRRVNRYLGGTHAVLNHLRRWAHAWPPGRIITILDVATGSGDIPLAISRWAQQAGRQVHITAVDRHPATLEIARKLTAAEPGIHLLRGDALQLPFSARSFDYVISSMFLHHLSDLEVMTVLKIMDNLCRCGMIWNDLLRQRRAYLWCRAFTLWSDPIIRHDGPVSVLAGFHKREVLDLRERLGLGYLRYQRHFGHRFTLAGQWRSLPD